MDPSKIKAILNWPIPIAMHDVWSFHGLASLIYLSFNSILAPIIECLKGNRFKWTNDAHDCFKLIKSKVTEAPCLMLLYFHKVFEVERYASNSGIDVVLSQEGKSIAFFF